MLFASCSRSGFKKTVASEVDFSNMLPISIKVGENVCSCEFSYSHDGVLFISFPIGEGDVLGGMTVAVSEKGYEINSNGLCSAVSFDKLPENFFAGALYRLMRDTDFASVRFDENSACAVSSANGAMSALTVEKNGDSFFCTFSPNAEKSPQ